MCKRILTVLSVLSGPALFIMSGAGLAQVHGIDSSSYSIHPPRISVPDGQLGAVRRSLMQFYGWTLICDETIARKRVVCNVTQAVVDGDGNEVFSWSLAATDNGHPFMLLRIPANANKNVPVELGFRRGKQQSSVKIPFIGCDANVCLAQTPVGPILTKAIDSETAAAISYQATDGKRIMFNVSFAGLKQAVASIR
ncbi:MAG: Invasion associated locus B family protein [Candidatus Tokpelaia hoelldobleri]|uniref:Invasion associated locus B family protein n=1 Tax=Candidatus Tokpelaia hoelldobleri TaxID=1902579 RepID=A0A1U9JUY2_9HYPH|nr:MAG: Invasion associated locus B family protein [Candidatus Tokpelaia hoelldoblerii]